MIRVLVLTAQPSLPGCSLLHECGQLNALNSGKHPAHEISKGSFERKWFRMSSRTRVLLVVLLHAGDMRRGSAGHRLWGRKIDDAPWGECVTSQDKSRRSLASWLAEEGDTRVTSACRYVATCEGATRPCLSPHTNSTQTRIAGRHHRAQLLVSQGCCNPLQSTTHQAVPGSYSTGNRMADTGSGVRGLIEERCTLVFVTKDQKQVLTSRVQDPTETCIFINLSHLLLREEQTLAWDTETEYRVKKAGQPP